MKPIITNPYGTTSEIETGADIGMEILSDDIRLLFAAAAWAMFDFITDIRRVHPEIKYNVKLEYEDIDAALVDWLNELIFLHETEFVLFNEFELILSNKILSGVVRGEKIDLERHNNKLLIKAATYHDLIVQKKQTGWYARVILDI